jgi:type IV pilus assembly protein PilC
MANFEYVAWDESGNAHEGTKQANSQDDLLVLLRDEGLTPVSVNAVEDAAPIKKKQTVRYKKVKSGDLSTFCWQLSTMLEGGMPITIAIETIAEEMENKYFEEVLNTIAQNLERGEPLSECIGAYPKVFNALSRAMVLAGETGGSLVTCLQRLADYYANRDKLIRKVRGALAYPIFVVVFIVVIVVALMTFIIPRFTVMFDQFKGELPAFTRGFMFVYDLIMHNAHFIIGGIVLVSFAILGYSKTVKGHERLCRFALSAPLFGRIKLQAFVAMFCKTLSTLIASGVPILEAFEILAGMTSNDILKAGVLDTRERLVEGTNVAASMEASGFFPNVAVKMAQIGEQSGSLSSVMDKTSEYYEKKVDSLVSTMLGMMEPILIISVGAIVLVVILAMYLPIFSMSV